MDSISQWTADARNGDQDALTRLYEVTHGPLLQRIRLMMGRGPRREVDSMDLLQDVQVRVLGALDQFDGKGGTQALVRWMTSIARNRLRDLGRNSRADALESFSVALADMSDANAIAPSANMRKDEGWLSMIDALESLHPDHRQVIVLHNLDEMSFVTIAKVMARSERSVRLLYARSLVHLGSSLKRSRRKDHS